MKRLTILSCAMVFTALLSTSCKKGATSTSTTPQISFAMTSDNPLANLAAVGTVNGASVAGVASINWTSGTADISRFKLEAKRNNNEVEISSKNITNVDLFSLSPSVVSTAIDTGTYKEIEIKVMLRKSTTSDLPLVLKGIYTTAGGASIPVEFDFNDNMEIKVEAENVVVDGTKNIRSILSMHLNKLFAGVSPQQIDAAPRTSDVLVISSSINTSLYNKIKANLSSCIGSKGFEKHVMAEREKD
jgi:hypothetical protein